MAYFQVVVDLACTTLEMAMEPEEARLSEMVLTGSVQEFVQFVGQEGIKYLVPRKDIQYVRVERIRDENDPSA